METDIITYEHSANGRIYIVQTHFAGTKRLSEVLESMIELSLSHRAANQETSENGEINP